MPDYNKFLEEERKVKLHQRVKGLKSAELERKSRPLQKATRQLEAKKALDTAQKAEIASKDARVIQDAKRANRLLRSPRFAAKEALDNAQKVEKIVYGDILESAKIANKAFRSGGGRLGRNLLLKTAAKEIGGKVLPVVGTAAAAYGLYEGLKGTVKNAVGAYHSLNDLIDLNQKLKGKKYTPKAKPPWSK